MGLDGLALAALAAHLAERWQGARVVRALQPAPGTFIFTLRHWRDQRALYVSLHDGHPALWVGPDGAGTPADAASRGQHPSPFCMLLRKHLEPSRLVRVEQHGWELILHLYFETPFDHGSGRELALTLELIPRRPGMVLREAAGRVIDGFQRRPGQRGAHAPGELYTPPAPRDRTAPDAPLAQTAPVLRLAPAGQPLAAHMARQIEGLSEASARAVLARGGTDPYWQGPLPEGDVANVASALQDMAARCRRGEVEPAVWRVPGNGGAKPVDYWAFPLPHWHGQGTVQPVPDMAEAVRLWGEAFLQAEAAAALHRRLEKAVRRHLKRLTRKRDHRRADLRRAEAVASYKRWADLLTANLHTLPRGPLRQESVALTDWFADPLPSGEMPSVDVPVDPALTASENADSYYRKYRRYKEATGLILKQLEETEAEILALEQAALALEWDPSWRELQELEEELQEAGYLDGPTPAARRGPQPRKAAAPGRPYRLPLTGGGEIRVGRNNRQNDELTMRWARPGDIWLHTRQIPGAHVILRLPAHDAEDAPDPDALHTAALLAAWFSRARESQNVPVDYTRRRHVRKPRGARAGMVIYDHQRTLFVTPAPEVMEPVLARLQEA